MSTITEPPQPTAADPPPELTWRDAATPLSRASRRRWTVCFALLLVVLAVSAVDGAYAITRDSGPPILFVALLVVFGMLRRGTRRITAFDHPHLDERDIEARNSAYRIAYPLLGLVVIAALVLLAIGAPESTRAIHHDDWRETVKGWFVERQALRGLGLWIALWAAFLPTGALAWREPDALEPELAATGLSEPLRDALLGLALAAGIAADLIDNHNLGLLAFTCALALVGGLARLAVGQPMISRQRKWRAVIGIVMILIVVAIAVVAR